jgi:hypothetical protein
MKNNKNLNETKLKISALIFAVCLATVSFTACGESGGNSTASKNDESTIEETSLNEIESAAENSDSISTEEATADSSDSEYKPSDEIINTDFQSGLVQIGNDIFRNGGFYTVDQFVTEFGERYDFSSLNTDDMLAKEYNTLKFVSKNDPDITIAIKYQIPDLRLNFQKHRIGDCIVVQVGPGDKETTKSSWLPTGLKKANIDMTLAEAGEFCESLGLIKQETIHEGDSKRLTEVYALSDGECHFRVMSKENNLYGDTSKYLYVISGQDNSLQCGLTFIEVLKQGYYKSALESE